MTTCQSSQQSTWVDRNSLDATDDASLRLLLLTGRRFCVSEGEDRVDRTVGRSAEEGAESAMIHSTSQNETSHERGTVLPRLAAGFLVAEEVGVLLLRGDT